jgi:enoyl-CoA hydratase/3-hydroxyacyl-CoA dehydrogenase
MFIFKAAVVGAGTMGGEIAQTIAASGVPVVLKDVRQELVDVGLAKAREVTEAQLARLVRKEKLTQEQADAQGAEILARIIGTTTYEQFGDVDLVVEAVPERLELKQDVFAELDAATPGHAILASNTSALSISEIADATLRPDKVVGFHYFYPASVMPLVEVVQGEQTSSETVQAAVTFAQAIRKQPIVCAEAPGFVVNRVLTSAMSEIWREQEAKGLSIKKIDEGMGNPMGPYFLTSMLGLDTVLHVAEHLEASFGDERFYVSQGMKRLVAEGKLGAKTGGAGFYDTDGNANVEGDAAPDVAELTELRELKMLVEACLILEEGIAGHRDIDFGMIAGAGMDPRRGLLPPFMRADAEGLDTVLKRLEAAQERHGDRFEPPTILRRLVAQGRLGPATGQGFYPYAQPDADQPGEGVVKLETRGNVAIAWIDNPPVNSMSGGLLGDFAKIHAAIADTPVRVLVIASANPMMFCAGADIRGFTQVDTSSDEGVTDAAHTLFRGIETSDLITIAAVNGIAYGGGCELAMACDVRLAARSALFGQPEVKLGIIPGFGGTQRLPRLVGTSQALEMNLIGDPIAAETAFEVGLVNRVVEDHELIDTALAWARKLGGQAPLAVAAIKKVSGNADLDAGIEAEKAAFAGVFASADAREGIGAFLAKRAPKWSGS